MRFIHLSRRVIGVLSLLLIFSSAQAQPQSDPSSEKAEKIKAAALFISSVPADGDMHTWYDEVEVKLKDLSLDEADLTSLVPSVDALAASVKNFQPAAPAARISVEDSAKSLVRALSSLYSAAQIASVQGSLQASANPRLRALGQHMASLENEISSMDAETAGRRLNALYENMKTSGADPEVLARYHEALSMGSDAALGYTLSESRRPSGLRINDTPEWKLPGQAQTSDEAVESWLYGAPANKAGIWTASAAGMNPLVQTLENYAYRSQRRQLLHHHVEQTQEALRSLGEAGSRRSRYSTSLSMDAGPTAARAFLREHPAPLGGDDPVERTKNLEEWLSAAEEHINTNTSPALVRYREILAAIETKKAIITGDASAEAKRTAILEITALDNEASEILRDNQELAAFLGSKKALSILDENAERRGIAEVESVPISLPGAGTAERLARGLASLLTGTIDPQTLSENGKAVLIRAKEIEAEFITEFKSGKFFLSGSYEYEFVRSIDALTDPDKTRLLAWNGNFTKLIDMVKSAESSNNAAELEGKVTAVAQKLGFSEAETSDTVANYLKKFLNGLSYKYMSYDKPSEEELAAHQTVIDTARFRMVELKLDGLLKGGSLTGNFDTFDDLAAIFDGAGANVKFLENMETSDPVRFYAFMGALTDARGLVLDRPSGWRFRGSSLSMGTVEGGRSLRNIDALLLRVASNAANHPGEPWKPVTAADSAKLAFLASLRGFPGASGAAREALVSMRKDFVMSELLDRSATLSEELTPDAHAALDTQREAALKEPDPVRRDRLLRDYMIAVRQGLEGRLPLSEGAAILREMNTRERIFKTELADLSQRQADSDLMKEVLESIRALTLARGGRTPSETEIGTIVAAAQERHKDDPILQELRAIVIAREEAGADMARRMTAFRQRNPDFIEFTSAMNRHDQAVIEFVTGGHAPAGARYTVSTPEGRTATLIAGPPLDTNGRPIPVYRTRHSWTVTESRPTDIPPLVTNMLYESGHGNHGYRFVLEDGSEEFRSYDGRLVIKTKTLSDGRVVKNYNVDGLLAGTATNDPERHVTQVTNVVPGLDGIQEVRSSVDPAHLEIRVDDLMAMAEGPQRAAAIRARVEEMSEYINRQRRAYDAQRRNRRHRRNDKAPKTWTRSQREVLYTMLLHRLPMNRGGSRKGSRVTLSLWPDKASYSDRERGWAMTMTEVPRQPNAQVTIYGAKFGYGDELAVDHARVARDGRVIRSFKESYDSSSAGVTLRSTMVHYVSRENSWTTDYGTQPKTDFYTFDENGGTRHVRQTQGRLTVQHTTDKAFLRTMSAVGTGITGFGETIWYGAVGTGKLIVGGAIEVVSLGYAEDTARMYATEGLFNVVHSPLSKAIYGQDLEEQAYQSINEESRQILLRSEIGEGDARVAIERLTDTGGVLYRWGSQTDGLARAGLYAAGTFMDVGHGVTATLPLMFAGHGVTGLLRSASPLVRGLSLGRAGISEGAAILAGNATQLGVGGYFLYEAGAAMTDLPQQIRDLDWDKPDTVRAFNSNMSNIAMLLAATKISAGHSLRIRKGKTMGIDVADWTPIEQIGRRGRGAPEAVPNRGVVEEIIPEERIPGERIMEGAKEDAAVERARKLVNDTEAILKATEEVQRGNWQELLNRSTMDESALSFPEFLEGMRTRLTDRRAALEVAETKATTATSPQEIKLEQARKAHAQTETVLNAPENVQRQTWQRALRQGGKTEQSLPFEKFLELTRDAHKKRSAALEAAESEFAKSETQAKNEATVERAKQEVAETEALLSASEKLQKQKWREALERHNFEEEVLPFEEFMEQHRDSLVYRLEWLKKSEDVLTEPARRQAQQELWESKLRTRTDHVSRDMVTALMEMSTPENVRGVPNYGSTLRQVGPDCVIQTIYNTLKPYLLADSNPMTYYEFFNMVRWKVGNENLGVTRGLSESSVIDFYAELVGRENITETKITSPHQFEAMGNEVHIGSIKIGKGSHMIAIDGAIKDVLGESWDVFIRDSNLGGTTKVMYSAAELISLELNMHSIRFNGRLIMRNLGSMMESYRSADKSSFRIVEGSPELQSLYEAFKETGETDLAKLVPETTAAPGTN